MFIRRFYAITILAVVCAGSFAGEKLYGSIVVQSIVSNYDGDTFTVDIPQWPSIIGDRVDIRVSGVDTPEIHSKCPSELELAKKARDVTHGFLTSGKPIELRNIRRDKYFRIVADVFVENVNLADFLISAGLGKPYEGGTKSSWCPTI
jgi:micrococcal nuclease